MNTDELKAAFDLHTDSLPATNQSLLKHNWSKRKARPVPRLQSLHIHMQDLLLDITWVSLEHMLQRYLYNFKKIWHFVQKVDTKLLTCDCWPKNVSSLFYLTVQLAETETCLWKILMLTPEHYIHWYIVWHLTPLMGHN